MWPPLPPPAKQGQDSYPRVLSQTRAAPHHQLVTYALPGLRRAVVRVPEHIWLQQGHLDLEPALRAHLRRLLPPVKPDTGGLDTFDLSE
jgi:hypothetical protein